MKKFSGFLALNLILSLAASLPSGASLPAPCASGTADSRERIKTDRTVLAQNFEIPDDIGDDENPADSNDSGYNAQTGGTSQFSREERHSGTETLQTGNSESDGIHTSSEPILTDDGRPEFGKPLPPPPPGTSGYAEDNAVTDDEDEGFTELPSLPSYDDASRPDAGIVMLDSSGKLADCKEAGDAASAAGQEAVFSLDEIFNSDACAALSIEDKLNIIKGMPYFMYSGRASQTIVPRRLIVAGKDGSSLSASIYDLELLDVRNVKMKNNKGQGWSELLRTADREKTDIQQVVVNTESRKYHLPGASHLSSKARLYAFKDIKQAEHMHYEPCRVCFPSSSRYLSMSSSERRAEKEDASQIQGTSDASQDTVLINRVNSVGRRILKGNGFPPSSCRFIVQDSDEAQALSLPSGKIYITTGLLGLLESDDELAAVLSHELSHIVLQHGQANQKRSMLGGIFNTVMRYTARNYWAYLGGSQASKLVNKGFSRQQEYEADENAVFLCLGAGYDPNEFALILEKLDAYQKQAGRKFQISWFSTHPTSGQRIGRIKETCRKIEPLLQDIQECREAGDSELAEAMARSSGQYMKNKSTIESLMQSWRKLQIKPEITGQERNTDLR